VKESALSQTQTTQVQITFTHVGKGFDGGRGAKRVLAVDDVSLEVSKGEFLAIVGG